ncbi:MAG: hypothetical protein HC875_00305 [Anaerolineales bacterium]|nr:hypothetical protein [Anaerolineales bacterium]
MDQITPISNPITQPPSENTSSSRPIFTQGANGVRLPSLTSLSSGGGQSIEDFAEVLAKTQKSVGAGVPAGKAPVNMWRSLNFLKTYAVSPSPWPWTQNTLSQINSTPQIEAPKVQSVDSSASILSTAPKLSLADYPHPIGDNGRGIHWIPTVSQTPEVVDRFVDEAVSMGMKWVVFLNEGSNVGANDYLVKRLAEAGIEPVMRVYTPGLTPISGGLEEMVRHYSKMGVHYFQLYNEPNLMVETGGQFPSVDKYLDLWIPAAQEVIKAGGLPGFGALSPQGEMDDRDFLRQALNSLEARGQSHLLGRSWLAMHNYTGPRPLNDPDGFMRFRQYDAIIRASLGHSLPIVGTEGGTHITEHVSEQKQVEMVTGAYKYMGQREPYNFAYTYWILANGHDAAWDAHALIRPDGPTALAQALKKMNSGEMI